MALYLVYWTYKNERGGPSFEELRLSGLKGLTLERRKERGWSTGDYGLTKWGFKKMHPDGFNPFVNHVLGKE